MGALKVHSAELAEVKRMYTLPETRGQGVGRQLLDAIEQLARDKGIAVLKLETGAVAGLRAGLAALRARRLHPLRRLSRLSRQRLFRLFRKAAERPCGLHDGLDFRATDWR